MRDRIESFYYTHLSGEYESVTRWRWIYGHVSILFATALSGYTFARGRYLLTLLLVPFPLVYLTNATRRRERTKCKRTRRCSGR